MKPKSSTMSIGYKTELSEESIYPTIFNASTFVFPATEANKRSFELEYDIRDYRETEIIKGLAPLSVGEESAQYLITNIDQAVSAAI